MRCRESAVYAIENLGWIAVNCTRDGEMRTIENICDELLWVIKDFIND